MGYFNTSFFHSQARWYGDCDYGGEGTVWRDTGQTEDSAGEADCSFQVGFKRKVLPLIVDENKDVVGGLG